MVNKERGEEERVARNKQQPKEGAEKTREATMTPREKANDTGR